jgi:hypothetical protein
MVLVSGVGRARVRFFGRASPKGGQSLVIKE